MVGDFLGLVYQFFDQTFPVLNHNFAKTVTVFFTKLLFKCWCWTTEKVLIGLLCCFLNVKNGFVLVPLSNHLK